MQFFFYFVFFSALREFVSHESRATSDDDKIREMSRRHLTRMDDVLLFRARPTLAISPRATIRQRCICVDYICARVYKDVRARPKTKVFMYFLTKRIHLIHNLLDASFQSLQDDFANVSDTSSTTSRDERLFQHTMQTLK